MKTKPISQITSSPEKAAALVKNLKQAEDDQTARMGSDAVGILAASDPDQRFFITAPFKNMRLAQTGNANQVTNVLALMPPEQNGTLEDRYYKNGTPIILDKAGSGAGTSQINLIRAGLTPDGYYGGNKVLVQKRYKIFPAGEAYPDIFVYAVAVRAEPRGYALQPDERFDGGFYPTITGYIGHERPYGTTFPTDDKGSYLYTANPFTDEGWSGETFTVPYDPATRPVITSVVPSSFTLPISNLEAETIFIDLYGRNFINAGSVMLGPFEPGSISPVDDTHLIMSLPFDLVPGSYYPYIIGYDGQIGVADTPFVVDGPIPVASGPGYDQDIHGDPVAGEG